MKESKKQGPVGFLGLMATGLVTLALLLAGCTQLVDPKQAEEGDSTSKEPMVITEGKGVVRVLIGGGDSARTLMPSTPTFSKYVVDFTRTDVSEGPITETVNTTTANESGGALEPLVVELNPGTWKVAITGYTTFSATEYEAAYGEATGVSISAGTAADVAVTIRPIPETAWGTADDGILTYTITYPATGVSGTLTLCEPGSLTVVDTITLAEGGTATGSKVVAPGYYDAFISLINSDPVPKSAGVYTALHIYPGLETVISGYTFSVADFVSTKYLAGTATIIIPNAIELATVTVSAYTDSGRSTFVVNGITSTPVTNATIGSTGTKYEKIVNMPWLMSIPVDTEKVWFKLTATTTTPVKTYSVGNVDTETAATVGVATIPETGMAGIVLSMNIVGVTVSFSDLPADETITLTPVSTGDLSENNNLSWEKDTSLTVTLADDSTRNGLGFSYSWYLDNATTAISGATGSSFTRTARGFTVGRHILTCRVIPASDEPPYSKTVIFTVD
ncbi:MAG: hypothetical protein LBT14_00575 [Treponema sp.]|jgi:hypothetical protein|nr:hypothetical protein [Treponema sp.]